MKKIFLLLLMILTVSGCGGTSQDKPATDSKKSSAEVQKPPVEQKNSADKKILVAYFSRTGEEYGIGIISKGNTAIVAEHIAQKVGGDLFEIKPKKAYPNSYESCTEIAKRELESNARPVLAKNIDNLAQYDTIFLGYPIWWGNMPMIVYTFLESGDFSGKTIIPFCTHGGSGISNTEHAIAKACPNAKVLEGLDIVGKRCQDKTADVQKDVDAWLTSKGLDK